MTWATRSTILTIVQKVLDYEYFRYACYENLYSKRFFGSARNVRLHTKPITLMGLSVLPLEMRLISPISSVDEALVTFDLFYCPVSLAWP